MEIDLEPSFPFKMILTRRAGLEGGWPTQRRRVGGLEDREQV